MSPIRQIKSLTLRAALLRFRPNTSFNPTAQKLCFWVPSLRSAAGKFQRYPAYVKQSAAAPEWYDVASPHWRGTVGRAHARCCERIVDSGFGWLITMEE